MRRRWKDGTTHVVMTPQVLIERLVASVPRPRKHLVTYNDVLAPASGLRPWIVPRVEEEEERDGCFRGESFRMRRGSGEGEGGGGGTRGAGR